MGASLSSPNHRSSDLHFKLKRLIFSSAVGPATGRRVAHAIHVVPRFTSKKKEPLDNLVLQGSQATLEITRVQVPSSFSIAMMIPTERNKERA